jgi:predicted alpha/beta-hydrolase family hydrolase
MNLLVLGGLSPRNKEYVHRVADALGPLFEKTVVHEYAHWATSDSHMDLQHELNVLRARARELGGDYVIFAKSAGGVLVLKAIAAKTLRPRACLFAGLPLSFARQHSHEIDEWLKALTMPSVFVQNSHDPTGSYRELERFLSQHARGPHYQTIELPGDTHDYLDMPKLKDFISQFLTP